MGDRPAYATISRVGGPWPTFSPALRSAFRLKPGGHVRMLDGSCDSTKLTSTVAAGPIGSSQTDGSAPRSRCGPAASGSAWLRVTCRHRSPSHRMHRCGPPLHHPHLPACLAECLARSEPPDTVSSTGKGAHRPCAAGLTASAREWRGRTSNSLSSSAAYAYSPTPAALAGAGGSAGTSVSPCAPPPPGPPVSP